MTHSVLQYNYSHDNDGSGYLLAQFAYARRFGGNIIRYNISENDSAKNNYGSLSIHGGVQVADLDIYNNTLYIADSSNHRVCYFKRPSRPEAPDEDPTLGQGTKAVKAIKGTKKG